VVCSILHTIRDKSLFSRVALLLFASYGDDARERKSLKVRNNAQTSRCESL
jgi:hypothetical protein